MLGVFTQKYRELSHGEERDAFVDWKFPHNVVMNMPLTWKTLIKMFEAEPDSESAAWEFLNLAFRVNHVLLGVIQGMAKGNPIECLTSDLVRQVVVGCTQSGMVTVLGEVCQDKGERWNVSVVCDDTNHPYQILAKEFVIDVALEDKTTDAFHLFSYVFSKASINREPTKVVCDTSNNSEEDIANQVLRVDVVVTDQEHANAIQEHEFIEHHRRNQQDQSREAASGPSGPSESTND